MFVPVPVRVSRTTERKKESGTYFTSSSFEDDNQTDGRQQDVTHVAIDTIHAYISIYREMTMASKIDM